MKTEEKKTKIIYKQTVFIYLISYMTESFPSKTTPKI